MWGWMCCERNQSGRHRAWPGLLAAALALILTGCAPGEGPFLQVHVCLNSMSEIEDFKAEIREIALLNGMEYGDRSLGAAMELEAIRTGEFPEPDAVDPDASVNIAAWSSDGRRVSAGNSFLPSNQFAVGFGHGADREASTLFADRVVERLRERWRVTAVANNAGVVAMDCESAD